MEQNGISIIPPSGVSENTVGKSKSIGITLRSNGTIQSAREKLKAPWLKKTEEGSTKDKIRAVLGEMIGTAIIVFVGCMSCLGRLNHSTKDYVEPPAIDVAFAFGFAIMIAIQCVGHISGSHLNPAISAAAAILGNKSILMTLFYVVAQCLGALLGFGLLQMIVPKDFTHGGDSKTTEFCNTKITNDKLNAIHGFAAEILATGIFAFFACASWDPRNAKNTDSLPLKFGLCITGLCFAFVPISGCSLNPARSFGPAVWNNYWKDHWIYWVGPITGAIIAALIYRFIFSLKTKSQENLQDIGTLNGIET